jgi:hypothetical protein
MSAAAHRRAIAAGVRDDLRRCVQALEALQSLPDRLALLIEPDAPTAPELTQVPRSIVRPAAALAEALVRYLAAGGRLEADLEEALQIELDAARARRSPTARRAAPE